MEGRIGEEKECLCICKGKETGMEGEKKILLRKDEWRERLEMRKGGKEEGSD